MDVRAYLAAAMAVIVFAGCESKFADKQPYNSGPGVTFEGMSSSDLDQNLATVDASTAVIQKILKDLRRIQKAQRGVEAYTQLDFFFELNEELKGVPSLKEGEGYVKYGKIDASKVPGITPECRIVETKISTISIDDVYGAPVDENGNTFEGYVAPKQGIAYSVKTCKTGNEYKRIAYILTSEWQSEMRFDDKGLAAAFSDIFAPSFDVGPNCKVNMSKERLETFVCENLTAKLSDSEVLRVNKLQYKYGNDPLFYLDGRVSENNQDKQSVYFELNKSGKLTKFKWDKVN